MNTYQLCFRMCQRFQLDPTYTEPFKFMGNNLKFARRRERVNASGGARVFHAHPFPRRVACKLQICRPNYKSSTSRWKTVTRRVKRMRANVAAVREFPSPAFCAFKWKKSMRHRGSCIHGGHSNWTICCLLSWICSKKCPPSWSLYWRVQFLITPERGAGEWEKGFTQKWMRHRGFSTWGIQTGPCAAC